MALASTLILLLFFLSMLLMPLTSQEKDNENFDEWISLNVKHYNSRNRETSLKWTQESIKHKKQHHVPPPPVSSSFDPKLIYAEMNKMIITVSQDGSSNFSTIKEALATIPLYNKRRVILDIKPGVYRYVPQYYYIKNKYLRNQINLITPYAPLLKSNYIIMRYIYLLNLKLGLII